MAMLSFRTLGIYFFNLSDLQETNKNTENWNKDGPFRLPYMRDVSRLSDLRETRKQENWNKGGRFKLPYMRDTYQTYKSVEPCLNPKVTF